MQDVTLNIYKQRVIDKIDTETAYNGSKRIGADKDAYDRISTKIGNADILGQWIEEGMTAAVAIMRKYNLIEDPAEDEEKYTIEVGLTSNWDERLIGSLTDAVTEFVATDVLVKWYTMVGETESSKNKGFQGDIVGARILAILNTRRRPNRPAPYEFKEVE